MAIMPKKSKRRAGQKKTITRLPDLGSDVAFLLCGALPDGGHQGLIDGDYSIQLFGNSRGFKKLGKYFTALAKLNTSYDPGFHHHFFQVRSLTQTKIELTVRKNKTADLEGMI